MVTCLGEVLWEKHEGLSDCEPDSCAPVRGVLVVTGVRVSPSSVVTEFSEVFSCCTDWGRCCAGILCTSTKEEMRYEGSQVKAPPLSKRRMMPPTLRQNSYASEKGSRRVTKWKTGDGVREKERSLQERSSTWKKVTAGGRKIFETFSSDGLSWPMKKSRQEYKVSGSRNRQSENTWSK